MKPLFMIVLLGGFGDRMNTEIQEKQALQSQLDEARTQLQDAQKLIAQQQQAQPKNAASDRQWMWNKDPSNPLNAPASRIGHGVTH